MGIFVKRGHVGNVEITLSPGRSEPAAVDDVNYHNCYYISVLTQSTMLCLLRVKSTHVHAISSISIVYHLLVFPQSIILIHLSSAWRTSVVNDGKTAMWLRQSIVLKMTSLGSSLQAVASLFISYCCASQENRKQERQKEPIAAYVTPLAGERLVTERKQTPA